MTAPATLPDIDAMDPGPEMDFLVAERVMGVRYIRDRALPRDIDPAPPYSTSDAAALEVFKGLARKGNDDDDAKSVWAIGYEAERERWWCTWEYDRDGASAPTLALAICRAALKSLTAR